MDTIRYEYFVSYVGAGSIFGCCNIQRNGKITTFGHVSEIIDALKKTNKTTDIIVLHYALLRELPTP